MPFTDGNRIDVLRNGCRIFPAMLAAIGAARRSVEFLTFIYWTGAIANKFAEALAERAAAGVRVRVLLDAFGAAPMPRHLIADMQGAGVDIRWFRPLSAWKPWRNDNRTHRKVLVVDGTIGFTGGVGIAEEWAGDARNEREWRDTHFRIEGPAVHGLRAAFLGNWVESGGSLGGEADRVLAAAPAGTARIQVVRAKAAVGWSDIAVLFQTAIICARNRIRVATPYFAPDDTSVRLLIDAAAVGVEVTLIIPGPHIDKRVSSLAGSNEIEQLLVAGIRIFRYQPTMIHVKAILIDAAMACIGSANFNHRSQLMDDEIALVTDCPDTIATLGRHFDADLAQCEQLTLDDWRARGVTRRLQEAAARLFRRQV